MKTNTLLTFFTIILLISNLFIIREKNKEINNLRLKIQTKAQINELDFDIVTATIYNCTEFQTDNTPLITASGKTIYTHNIDLIRYCAVSRDLLHKYPYGTKIQVYGAGKYDGVWNVEDTMNKRYNNCIDFLVPETDKLNKFFNVKIYKIEL